MKTLLKAITGTVLAAFLLFSHTAVADAAVTRTLDENTRITPPGLIVAKRAEIPMFKKGTVVTLNEYGEVLEGILAEGIDLPYETGESHGTARMSYTPPTFVYVPMTSYITPKNRTLPFKGGTKVTFNDKGEVINGTINSSSEIIVLNPTNHIAVGDGEIIFHRGGMPATCILAGDAYLRIAGWQQTINDNFSDGLALAGFVEFKGGKPVKLNEKGEVVKGTLNKDTKLLGTSLTALDVVAKKTYEAGTTVEFDDKGIVVKATK